MKRREQIPRRRTRLALAALLALCLCLTSLTGCGSQAAATTAAPGQEETPDWQSQYDLGIRLLEEGNYEEAIVAFLAAIEIDPKKPDAYLGLAEVYLATDEPQKAADVLSQGLEAAEDTQEILAKLEELKEQYPELSIPALESGQGANAGTGEDAKEEAGQDPFSDAVIRAMEEVIPEQFDFAAPFCGGYARVGRLLEDGTMKYFFIDESGQAISGEYDMLTDFREGLALVGTQNSDYEENYYETFRYGYIDTTGREVISLESEVYGLPFYEGMAEIYWYDESGTVYSNLIDREGNKVLPFDCVDVDMGYGGYGLDWRDGRVLPLTGREEASLWAWNPVQFGRVEGSFPVEVYDGTQTCWLAEDFSVVETREGYRQKVGEDLYIYYTSPEDLWEIGTLMNEAGETLAEHVSGYVEEMEDGCLLLQFEGPANENGYSTWYSAIYSRTGERLSEDYAALKEWTGGYIVSKELGENRSITVTDRDFNPLFTTEGNDVSQIGAGYAWEFGGVELENAPALFFRSYTYESGEGVSSGREIVDAAGQVVLADEPGSSLSALSDRYLVRERENETVLYGMDGQQLAVLSGIINLNPAVQEGLYSYRTAEDREAGIYQNRFAYLEEQNGQPALTDTDYEMYLDYNLYRPQELLAEGVLAENKQSALRGPVDVTQPVSLWQGDAQTAEAAGLSLIGNNLYKQAGHVVFLEDWYDWEIGEVSLHTADGSWSSAVYEDMGVLSYNFISFKRGGKWGYLKAVQ